MPDIISAKCFGCGNIVRVPAALGGKKARCPKCAETIVIPAQADSNAELVSDTDLPEVARDDEVLEGEEIEAEEGELVEESSRSPAGTRRPGSSSRGTKAVPGRGGTQKRGMPARGKGSPVGLFIGIGIAVVAIIAVVAVAASGGKGGGKKKDDEKGAKQAQQAPKIDPELEGRFQEYVRALEKEDPARILKFYSYDPAEAAAANRAVNALVEQKVKYEGAVVRSADGESGAVSFTYKSGGGTQEKSLQWTKVGGAWMLAGKPQ